MLSGSMYTACCTYSILHTVEYTATGYSKRRISEKKNSQSSYVNSLLFENMHMAIGRKMLPCKSMFSSVIIHF